MTFSATALPVALATQATAALVPEALVKSTLKASLLGTAGKAAAVGVVPAQVFTLTKEVTKAMFLTKLQMVIVTTLAVGVIGASAAGVTYVLGKGGDGKAVVTTAENALEADKLAQLIKEKKLKVLFTGEKLTFSGFGDEKRSFNYKLDPSKKPKTFDAVADIETLKGIYTFDGKELKLCFGSPEFQRSFPDDKEPKVKPGAGARPKDFINPPGAELWVCEYKGPAK